MNYKARFLVGEGSEHSTPTESAIRVDIAQCTGLPAQALAAPMVRLMTALAHHHLPTYKHSLRVACLTAQLATALDYTSSEQTTLTWAALFHDVGKLNLPRQLLGVQRPLTPTEASQLQTHVQHSLNLVSSISCHQLIPAIAAHHERPDGLGYPQGLRGTHIPPAAALLAVADALDVFQTESPLLVPHQSQLVGQRLLQGAGTEWDEAIVYLALRVFGIGTQGEIDHGPGNDRSLPHPSQ